MDKLIFGQQPFSRITSCFQVSLYSVFLLKSSHNNDSICKLWWHQYNKTNEFCFLVFVTRTYRTALQQTTIVSNTFSKTSIHRNFVISRCIVVIFGTSLSRYVLLNASRKAANDFNAKYCSRMNTRSALEFTMFAPAHLLRNWREQRLSNKGDLDSSVTGVAWRVHYTGLLVYVLNSTPCSIQALGEQ
jgi:hypothetical protein